MLNRESFQTGTFLSGISMYANCSNFLKISNISSPLQLLYSTAVDTAIVLNARR